MATMLDLTQNRYSSQWRADNASISWRPDNVGGEKSEVETRTGGQYDVHASETGWIVARGGKVFGSGKSTSLDSAKKSVEKFIKDLEVRGL
jgi:hypothetical protein